MGDRQEKKTGEEQTSNSFTSSVPVTELSLLRALQLCSALPLIPGLSDMPCWIRREFFSALHLIPDLSNLCRPLITVPHIACAEGLYQCRFTLAMIFADLIPRCVEAFRPIR